MVLIHERTLLADELRRLENLSTLNSIMTGAERIIESTGLKILPEVRAAFDKAIQNDENLYNSKGEIDSFYWAAFISGYAKDLGNFARVEVLKLLANHDLFDFHSIDPIQLEDPRRVKHYQAEYRLARIPQFHDADVIQSTYKDMYVNQENFYLLLLARHSLKWSRRSLVEINEKIAFEIGELIGRHHLPRLAFLNVLELPSKLMFVYDPEVLGIIYNTAISRWTKNNRIEWLTRWSKYQGANADEINQWADDKLADLN